jgi:hypothetical protein
MIRKILLAALIGASFAGVPLASFAQVTVRIAPPPPRQEAIPAPRRGMVWAPGHWEGRGVQARASGRGRGSVRG